MPVRTVLVALIGAALAVLQPSVDTWGAAVLGAALLAGLPHGAADHATVRRAWWAGGQVGFHVAYVLIVGLVVALWGLSPAAALLLFGATSVWHFGESDLLHVPGAPAAKLTRGLLLLVAPLLLQPEPAVEILGDLSGLPLEPASLGGLGPALAASIAGAHALSLGIVAHQRGWAWSTLRTELAAAAAVGLLVLGGGPVLGVALYFVLWHTPDHFRTLGLPLREMVPTVLPRTLLAAAAVTGLALTLDPGHWPLAVMLGISALTLPHALVVHLAVANGREGARAPRASGDLSSPECSLSPTARATRATFPG